MAYIFGEFMGKFLNDVCKESEAKNPITPKLPVSYFQ